MRQPLPVAQAWRVSDYAAILFSCLRAEAVLNSSMVWRGSSTLGGPSEVHSRVREAETTAVIDWHRSEAYG